jgi:beta-glucosidase
MPSYSSWDNGSGPVKMHGNKYLITDVLKGELGFKGFVISDWQAIDQIPGDYRSDVVTSVNAGLDMIMVPYEYQQFETLLLEEVKAGHVAQSRIDDAVARILRKKFELGLFEHPYTDRTHIAEVGSPAHRAVARQAAAESQTLLKNTGNLLPLKKDAKLYVAGGNADDLGNQAGGWSVTWQGSSGPITAGTTVLQGIKEHASAVTYSRDASADLAGHDVGIVVVGETPYAEGVGDVGNGRADLKLSAADNVAIDKVCGAMKCVVLVVSGRPMELDGTRLGGVESLVASWLPGTEGAGVADALFGVKPYSGRLPMTWPKATAQEPINVGDKAYEPLYAYGWGLRTDASKGRLQAARDGFAAAATKPGGGAPLDRFRLNLAVQQLDRTLGAASNWNADGSVRDAQRVLTGVQNAADLVDDVQLPIDAYLDPLVSVARDVTQAQLVANPGAPKAAQAAALTATAESSLLHRDPYDAVEQLFDAYKLVR